MITPKPEFDGVAQGGSTDYLNGSAAAETHLEQTAAQIRITLDGNDPASRPNRKLAQRTSHDRVGTKSPGRTRRAFMHVDQLRTEPTAQHSQL
jgi:hypothetical protein